MGEIRVFVSSKQGELDLERAIVKQQVEAAGLVPVLAEDWGPGRTSIREVFLDKVRSCPIYVGLFYRVLSAATVAEYQAALGNPYREIMIYVRDTQMEDREAKLSEFLEEMGTRHVYFRYGRPENLLSVVSRHICEAVERMIYLLVQLGKASVEGVEWGENATGALSTRAQFLRSLGFEDGEFNAERARLVNAELSRCVEVLRRIG
jgi:hypothetical protein